MNWLDIVILITLVVGGFVGWRTGVIKAVLSAVGVVAGIFLAGRFGGPLGESLEFITNDNLANIVGFVVIFAAIFIAAMVTANMLKKLLNLILLGWVDGFGGTALGAGVAAVVWTVLVAAVGSFPIGGLDRSIEESPVATYLADNVSFVLTLLPEQYRDVLSLGKEAVLPTVTVSGVSVEDASAQRLSLLAAVSLDNPNRFGATITSVRYQLFSSDAGDLTLLGTGEAKDVRLKAKGVTELELPLELTGTEVAAAAPAVGELMAGRALPVRLKGTMTVSFLSGSIEVPFEGDATAQGPS